MKATLFTVLCALGMLHAGAAPREVPAVLFIGNSYTFVNDLPAAFDAVCKAGKTKMHVDSFTEGSCALVDFYELPRFAQGKKKPPPAASPMWCCRTRAWCPPCARTGPSPTPASGRSWRMPPRSRPCIS